MTKGTRAPDALSSGSGIVYGGQRVGAGRQACVDAPHPTDMFVVLFTDF